MENITEFIEFGCTYIYHADEYSCKIILNTEGDIVSLKNVESNFRYKTEETIKSTQLYRTNIEKSILVYNKEEYAYKLSNEQLEEKIRRSLKFVLDHNLDEFKQIRSKLNEKNYAIAEEVRKEALAEAIAKYDF